MKYCFTILTLLIVQTVFGQNPCEKCDIEKVKIVNENLDRLTDQMVREFLCTFDNSCNDNAEYSEYSNETFFAVLEKNATLFFQVITKDKLDNKVFLKEIESPVNDSIDLQTIYDKIKLIPGKTNLKNQYLNALILAAEKGGQKLKT